MIDTPVFVFYIETKPHFLIKLFIMAPFLFSISQQTPLLYYYYDYCDYFKYARVETTCHVLTLFSEIGVFRVFDSDCPFGIGSSVRYFTILAQSELPRPLKILICRIARGVPNDFDIVYKKKRATWRPSLSKEKRAKSWNYR